MEDNTVSDSKPSTVAAAVIPLKDATKDEQKSDYAESKSGGRKKKLAAEFLLKLESYFFEHTSSKQPAWFKALVDQSFQGKWVSIHEISKMDPHFPPLCPALRILLRKYSATSKIVEIDEKVCMVRQRSDCLKAIDCGLFVDNLPPEADDKWVKDTLNNYGPILSVEIPRRNPHSKNDGICFVYFSQCDTIPKILQYFDRQSRIFAKLEKSSVSNRGERSAMASFVCKVPPVEKIDSQPLPLHIDTDGGKSSPVVVDDGQKLQFVDTSSKLAEKSSSKRKLSGEKSFAPDAKSKRFRKRSKMHGDQVIKKDKDRNSLESAIDNHLKSTAHIVDVDREKKSTSSSIDSSIKQDERGESSTERNKQLVDKNKFGESYQQEKKHVAVGKIDDHSSSPKNESTMSSAIPKTSHMADLTDSSLGKMKRSRGKADGGENIERSKRKKRRSNSVIYKDSKDGKRRHAQSDDELIAARSHKRVKLDRHHHRHRHHDEQTHQSSPPPLAASTTKKHCRKKNFSRKRRYLKSRMQRRLALENLNVCTYAEWLSTKEKYKKAQKAAFSLSKDQLKNSPLVGASEFKRGKDKWLQKAEESMSKFVPNAS